MCSKNKKRILTSILLAALTLSGCGNFAQSANVPTPVETPTTEPSVTPTEAPAPTQTPTPEPTKAPEVVYPKIKEVFGEQNMKAGTCLTEQMIANQYQEKILKENFNSVTFENHLKPDYMFNKEASKERGELVVEINPTAVKLFDWCKENGMAVRGHTLVWYSQTPSWIFYDNFETSGNLVGREEMLNRLDSYIRQVFERLDEAGYLEIMYAYDVVNEAWMEDGTMRDCLWKQIIGEDYLWQAFNIANKYAPESIDLYYNDYNEQFKTDTLYNFVQTLKDEDGNYLIDGIGFQAHLYTEDSLEDYFATLEKLGSLGLKIELTELDVCLGSWPVIKPAVEKYLKEQGRFYYNLIEGIFALKAEGKITTDALTFWGFSDAASWRKERSPLLYSSLNIPKYAYYGAIQVKEKAGFEEE